MIEEMNDSMSSMVLVGLSQSEWESIMQFIAKSLTEYEDEDNICKDKEKEDKLNIIIRKLTNQIY